MNIKKALATILATLMLGSCVACATTNEPADTDEPAETKPVVVWTWTEDLQQFAEKYTEETGVPVEIMMIDGTDNYSIKIETTCGSKSSEVDIICGEPQMLDAYYEGEFLVDLGEYATAEELDTIVDFVVDVGTDDNGVIRALSYQMTPGSIIYRRDLALEMFGTDDPAEIGKLFADYDTMIETARTCREFGYYLFASTSDLSRYSSAGEAWVKDGVVNLSDARMGYFDAAVAMFEEGLVANATEWSGSWYMSMGGAIPAALDTVQDNIWGITAEELEELAETSGTTQVFSYSLPTWGALIVRDNAGDLKGQFGVCSGPCSYTQGGTWLGINTYSENKEEAWKFVQWVTCNQETAEWWIEHSEGDVVANKKALEAYADYENANFGNQKTYAFYLEEAAKVDYSIYTIYDQDLGAYFGTAISNVQTGQMDKEAAIEDFKANITAIYPELSF